MKLLHYTFIISVLLSLVSCLEKTAENSIYSDYIKQLNTSFNSVDSTYRIFNEINHEILVEAHKAGSKKYSLVKNVVSLDSIDSFYDINMNVYKSIYVKGLKNVEKKKAAIEKEFEYSQFQINTLIPNLIQENFTKDSASLYFNSETEALYYLQKEIDNYNSTANNALNLQDSLNNNLDSLIRKYDKNAN